MKKIKTVGVVGAGTMGSALAQKFSQEGFRVILCDRERQFTEKGVKSIRRMLQDGLEKKIFTQEQVDSYLFNIMESHNLSDLRACDIVIEAIFENFDAKSNLFKELNTILHEDTILATNTSSFSVSELAKSVSFPERFIGVHYFYHAAKNRLVEIIPGDKTSEEVVENVKRFSILSGKDAIICKDTYGFAVNRFFVPWLNEAVKLLDQGIGTIEMIDAVCLNTFGIGMGPFALMNATGVPIALHAQRTLEFFGPSYAVAKLLEKQVAKKENWLIGDLSLTVKPELEKQITERMLGCVFFVCSQILNENVCSATDLNKGAKIGLRWRKGPVDLMKQSGEQKVKELVEKYAKIYGEKIPAISAAQWKLNFVTLELKGEQAVISMNRPEDLNALNEEVVKQLDEKFSEAENNPAVKTIFITGTGKAFVAGADIKYFVKNIRADRICDIETFTEFGQRVFNKIDNSRKKVVAIVNGLALGGGLELALCADMILALPKAQMGFPETGIGIYPGLGGTQRSAAKIGKGLSKYLIHTGKLLSAKDASDMGLADKLISADEMFDILSGEKPLPVVQKNPLNEKWQHVKDFFEKNSLLEILDNKFTDHILSKEEAEKIVRTISHKAPIAIKIADKLIEEAKGCDSELKHLREIFSTSDALLGLSSIGKKVVYEGK